MKETYPRIRLTRICRLLGVTRQAYYQHLWRKEELSIEEDLVLSAVKKIRNNHRHMGGRKLYEKLKPFLLEHQIKMGREGIFDLLSANHLLVRRKRRRVSTTQSFHWLRKYPNLIKAFTPSKINQLWVSDITYWKTAVGYVYISFITDAYSRKVVGYHVANSLNTVETIHALCKALLTLKEPPEKLIHHSDRGVQYCSAAYVKLLQSNGIQISMTEKGDPYENALAERVNGILKNEYLYDSYPKNLSDAKEILEVSVNLYNSDRPHMSIGYRTPEEVHQQKIETSVFVNGYTDLSYGDVNLVTDLEIEQN